MKTLRITSILRSSLIACTLTVGVFAATQSALAQETKALGEATIPFDFQTNLQSVPAGTYRIERISRYILQLRGKDANVSILVNDAYRDRVAAHGTLVFDHYGNKYFLRQVWMAESSEGLECPKGREEKNVLQAQNKPAPNSAELAFNAVPQR